MKNGNSYLQEKFFNLYRILNEACVAQPHHNSVHEGHLSTQIVLSSKILFFQDKMTKNIRYILGSTCLQVPVCTPFVKHSTKMSLCLPCKDQDTCLPVSDTHELQKYFFV